MKKFLSKILVPAAIFAAIFSAKFGVPKANALVVSEDGSEISTNTSSNSVVAEIWDRTAYLSAGTGVFVGADGDGNYYILTAAHVTTTSGTSTVSITASDGTVYTYTVVSSTILTNSDGSSADLKMVSITSSDAAALAYLDSLGTISVYSETLAASSTSGFGPFAKTTTTTLYAVGTGIASSVGSSYNSGTRKKTWGEFTFSSTELANSGTVSNGNYSTSCYLEIFSSSGTAIQGCSQDSGSGVFIETEDGWALVGIVLYVAAATTSSGTTINYAENASSEGGVCYTYYANLSDYADQISEILSYSSGEILVPEPNFFGIFVGLFALFFAGTTRNFRRFGM